MACNLSYSYQRYFAGLIFLHGPFTLHLCMDVFFQSFADAGHQVGFFFCHYSIVFLLRFEGLTSSRIAFILKAPANMLINPLFLKKTKGCLIIMALTGTSIIITIGRICRPKSLAISFRRTPVFPFYLLLDVTCLYDSTNNSVCLVLG